METIKSNQMIMMNSQKKDTLLMIAMMMNTFPKEMEDRKEDRNTLKNRKKRRKESI